MTTKPAAKNGNNLGVYIHIPFCNAKCAYCDFVSDNYPEETRQAYFLRLAREISGFRFNGRQVDTVFFGGGTPSSVDAPHITRLLGTLRSSADISEAAEITVECNPESLTAEKAAAYAAAGVNRLSIGLQTSNDALLKKIGRIHTKKDFFRACVAARKYFDNINVDLMLGLPGQTAGDVTDSVAFAAGLAEHISVYALKVEPGTRLHASGFAADDDAAAEHYAKAAEILSGKGFNRYEVSNFAKPGYGCRHNMKYWRLDNYIGFGAAAHSYLDGLRLENTPDIQNYISGKPAAVEADIVRGSNEDMDEYIMLALRTSDGIRLDEFSERFGFRIEQKKSGVIESLKNLLIIDNGRLRLAPDAFYIMNGIILKLL